MNGKKAKKLRRQAELDALSSPAMPYRETMTVVKSVKVGGVQVTRREIQNAHSIRGIYRDSKKQA